MKYYEQVRKENIIKYGTRVANYIPIIINQYSDRTHFIYELIQNAEDAGATYVRFHLFKDKLVLYSCQGHRLKFMNRGFNCENQ